MLIVLFAALMGCNEPPRPQEIPPEDFTILWSDFDMSGERVQQSPNAQVLVSRFDLAQLAEPGTSSRVHSLSLPLYEAPFPCQEGEGFRKASPFILARIESCELRSTGGAHRTLSGMFELDAPRSLVWLQELELEVSSTTARSLEVWCDIESDVVTTCLASDIPYNVPSESQRHGEPVNAGYLPNTTNVVGVSDGTMTLKSWNRTLPAPQ